MKTQTTPIKLWIWVGVIFILSQVLVVFIDKINKLGPKFNESHYLDQINFLNHESKKNDDSYNVVIIGSSLIAHGVACPNDIENFLDPSQKIKIFKIWGSGDPLKDFIDNNLISNLIESKPDLILIQTELAAISFAEKNILLKKIKEQSARYKSIIKKLLPLTKDVAYSSIYSCYPKSIDIQTSFDTISHQPYSRIVKDIDNLKYLTEGLTQLNKAGLKTIIVDMAKPKKSEKIIFTEPFTKNINSLLEILREKYKVEHWKYTGQSIHYKHCIDRAHLNKKGRDIYTKWLLDKIKEIN